MKWRPAHELHGVERQERYTFRPAFLSRQETDTQLFLPPVSAQEIIALEHGVDSVFNQPTLESGTRFETRQSTDFSLRSSIENRGLTEHELWEYYYEQRDAERNAQDERFKTQMKGFAGILGAFAASGAVVGAINLAVEGTTALTASLKAGLDAAGAALGASALELGAVISNLGVGLKTLILADQTYFLGAMALSTVLFLTAMKALDAGAQVRKVRGRYR